MNIAVTRVFISFICLRLCDAQVDYECSDMYCLQSELAWRMLSRKYGAQLCYTPMFHSQMFVQDRTHRRAVWSTCAQDRPLIAQVGRSS